MILFVRYDNNILLLLLSVSMHVPYKCWKSYIEPYYFVAMIVIEYWPIKLAYYDLFTRLYFILFPLFVSLPIAQVARRGRRFSRPPIRSVSFTVFPSSTSLIIIRVQISMAFAFIFPPVQNEATSAIIAIKYHAE